MWLFAFVLAASYCFIMGALEVVHAAEFFCASGDVSCLIAKINLANGMPGQHTINLEPGSYTLQAIDNGVFLGNGLPVISSSIRIQAMAEDLPTVIERDLNAPRFRIFEVAIGGELTLAGLTIQRGGEISAAAIFNSGVTSLEDSIVRDSSTSGGFYGAIANNGTLRVIRSIIADNSGGHLGGGIHNGNLSPFGPSEAKLLVENSTISGNIGVEGGGIYNTGSLVVKNSAIIFNRTDFFNGGGGILNEGSAEIVNTTIAKNEAGRGVEAYLIARAAGFPLPTARFVRI
jgi:hypothetical protein